MASTSARSCGRPDANFEAMRSSAEMKFAFKPRAGSTTVSTRLAHAASKSTPGMSGRIPTPRGSRPNRRKLLRSMKSSGRTPWSVAPNSASAACVACALAGVRFYEEVEVIREARLRVKDNGVASHNEVLNAMGMECGQKVFVVLEHPAPSPNL